MSLRPILIAATLTFSPLMLVPSAASAEPAVYTGRFSSTALQGNDAVAYFKTGTPTKGSDEFTAEYNGATFKFASAANRDAFVADPAAYAPQYGGYCAWAIADGKYAKGDARHWKIVDGKLYLNFNEGVQQKWNKDIPGFIAKGDAKWTELQN